MRPKSALRVIAFITAFAGVALLLLFPLRELVRTALLEPLITAYHIAHWYLLRLPQLLFWGAIFLFATYLLLRCYRRALGPPPPPRAQKRRAPPLLSEVAQVTLLLRRTHRHPFARRSLAGSLVKLTVRMIARREGLTLSEARERFASFTWCDDPAVEEFFRSRSPSYRWDRNADFHKKMQQTISFLERYYQGE
ncbi:hypothetical protein LR032_06665 [Candidatus Bipolaricaulota bacterium]|nr:hypothetical protein [Candidatus Bipolaricaulota bacterium]